VIAVNKADHPGARTTVNDVRQVLALGGGREVAIVQTQAPAGEGVPRLWEAIEEHRALLEVDGALYERRGRTVAAEVFAVASARAKAHLEQAVGDDPELRRLLDEVSRRELDPLTAVREIMERVFHVAASHRAHD